MLRQPCDTPTRFSTTPRLNEYTSLPVFKKMNDRIATNRTGKKSKKSKKVKNQSIICEEVKSFGGKEAETEDLAESVDSGCIPDSSSDIAADVTDPAQIEAALLKENIFISNLLRWLPASLQSKEPEPEIRKGKKRKNEEKRKDDEAGPSTKKQKVDVDPVDTNADLDQLQEKYRRILGDLRKNRNKKWDHATRKKEAKLAKKLKVLEKRKDKRTKNRLKLPKVVENKKEKNTQQNIQQNNPKNVKPQKPIYNKKGELVFSKFDFSSNNGPSGDIDTNMKSKDLKQILSQALKEKEKMKHLEKKGDKEGAISIADQKAWSSALQKAEGKKVKSDVDMLKKSIKKQEIRKKTSQKKWEQRLETIKKHKADKQNQRKKNITSRKEAKLDKKMKKMKKRGHIVPGF